MRNNTLRCLWRVKNELADCERCANLARELTIMLGVLAERRRSVSRWAKEYWIPVGIAPASGGLTTGDVMLSDDERTRYFMGVHALTCHAADTEAYVHNFNSQVPALFIVLRRSPSEDGHPLPWFVHSVTASPYLAQDYDDSGEDIVERVPMPPDITETLKDFVNRYHQEEEFKKRRRDKLDLEDHKFGKEPIFLQREKPAGGNLDG